MLTYCSWIYTVPDGATDEDLWDIAEACAAFKSAMKNYSNGGCYIDNRVWYPNLLNRCFDQAKPNQFWVTDITYIPIPGSMLYMCAVLDLCGKAVLAWKIGSDMSSSLVTDTIREALRQEKVTGGLALHSDQGSQYTSRA